MTSSVTAPAAGSAQIGSALSPESTKVAAKRSRAARLTRLSAAKPHAGTPYSVQLSFGRVPVATAALTLHCGARLAGRSLAGAGAIAGQAATGSRSCAARACSSAHSAPGASCRQPAPGVDQRAAASSSAVRWTARTIFW